MTVECWNGQYWQPAYVATGLGGAGDVAFAELESEVVDTDRLVAVATSTLELPVPPSAPVTDYRVTASARACDARDGCASVPLETTFAVAAP